MHVLVAGMYASKRLLSDAIWSPYLPMCGRRKTVNETVCTSGSGQV
ncbi:hypothetical protein KCP73_14500 [Salmonella enterica subsp. enterica]|nr:hypothetical protein KCP73_14500 [Salmonella enterica subsp. enterica]